MIPQPKPAAPQSVIALRGRLICTYASSAFINLRAPGLSDCALQRRASRDTAGSAARTRNDALIFTLLCAVTFVLELIAFGALG
jgi:hypothetical protein